MYVLHSRRVKLGTNTDLWKSSSYELFHTLSVRKNGKALEGNRKLLKRFHCACLQPASVTKCACPICIQLERNLATFHKQRIQWRPEGLKSSGSNECTYCAGRCQPGGSQFQWSASISDLWTTLVCPEEWYPQLDVPRLCPKSGKEDLTAPPNEFCVHAEACVKGECKYCG